MRLDIMRPGFNGLWWCAQKIHFCEQGDDVIVFWEANRGGRLKGENLHQGH